MRAVLFILLFLGAGTVVAQEQPRPLAASPSYRLDGVALGPTTGAVARGAAVALTPGGLPARVAEPLVAVRAGSSPGVAAAPPLTIAGLAPALARPRWPEPRAHVAGPLAAPPGVDPAPPPVRPG